VITIVIWALMVGVEMLMRGLSCVEELLSLLLQKSTWLVTVASVADAFQLSSIISYFFDTGKCFIALM